jgi:hypothetical protein
LPGLTWNDDPPDLCLRSSLDLGLLVNSLHLDREVFFKSYKNHLPFPHDHSERCYPSAGEKVTKIYEAEGLKSKKMIVMTGIKYQECSLLFCLNRSSSTSSYTEDRLSTWPFVQMQGHILFFEKKQS